jgi:hypothetical protein
MRELVNQGSYKIPSSIKVSEDCVDFFNKCLRMDSKKRMDFKGLLQHPFLQNSGEFQKEKQKAISI